MDKVSYALGLGVGSQLKSMGAESLNIDDFAQAIKDILSDAELKVSHAESQQIVQKFFQEQEAKQRAQAAENGKKAREEGRRCRNRIRTAIYRPQGRQRQVTKGYRHRSMPL